MSTIDGIGSEYWITLAHHRVRVTDIDGEVSLSLPCLAGEDVNRYTSTVSVSWSEGVPYDLYSNRIAVTPAGLLWGWGNISCDESVRLKPEMCAWSVQLPRDLWEAACAWIAKQ